MEENKNTGTPGNTGPTGNPNVPPRPGDRGKINPKKDETKEKKKSSGGTVFMMILIIGLVGVVGFLLFRDNKNTKKIKAQAERIDTDSVKIAEQIKLLDERELQLERMKLDAQKMGLKLDSLTALVEDVQALKREIRNWKGTAWSRLQKIKDLNAKIDAKDLEIEQLAQDKIRAMVRADSLAQEGSILKDTISRMTEERTELQQKIALASILKAEEFKITGLNSKGKEYADNPLKTKQLAKLKVQLALGENKVARKNEKEVIMRLIEPDGTVLFSGVDGGSFTSTDGEEKLYTLSQSVAFEGNKKPITFIYQKGNEYKPGKHVIEIYAEGHKIGETSFQVK